MWQAGAVQRVKFSICNENGPTVRRQADNTTCCSDTLHGTSPWEIGSMQFVISYWTGSTDTGSRTMQTSLKTSWKVHFSASEVKSCHTTFYNLYFSSVTCFKRQIQCKLTKLFNGSSTPFFLSKVHKKTIWWQLLVKVIPALGLTSNYCYQWLFTQM